jgi:uncharacterized metal-binding protein
MCQSLVLVACGSYSSMILDLAENALPVLVISLCMYCWTRSWQTAKSSLDYILKLHLVTEAIGEANRSQVSIEETPCAPST